MPGLQWGRPGERATHRAESPSDSRPTTDPLLLADGQRAVRHLDQDAAALDHHRIDLERQLRWRIERLAVAQVEPRQVKRAGERPGRQKSLVELEVLVAADT